jgi:hypothetical protein
MDVLKPAFEYDYNTGDYGTLKNLNAIWSAVQTPFSLLDASGNATLSIAYMDASLAARDTRLNKSDASVYTLLGRHNFTETSLNVLTSRHNFTETSLGVLTSRHNFTETSLYVNFNTNASLGLAFNKASNASLGLAFNKFAEASLGLAFNKFAEASLGSNLHYRTDLGVGLRNASGNLYDVVQINSSIYIKIGATTWVQFAVGAPTLG